MSYMNVLVFDLILISGCLIGCSGQSQYQSGAGAQYKDDKTEKARAANSPQFITPADDETLKMVKDFVGGDASALDAATLKIASLPRQDLIDSLLRLKEILPHEDRRQVSIAFVLCNLDYDYDVNRKVLTDAFDSEPHTKNYDADWEMWLIDRLVLRGDKSLMTELVYASKWSDGGMSEALSGMYAEHLRDSTSAFVDALSSVDFDTRQEVYELIDVGEMESGDVVRIKRALSLVRSNSVRVPVVKELQELLGKGQRAGK